MSSAPKYRPTEESLSAAHLKEGTDRKIRAARPRPGAEPMRVAYLELLKLCRWGHFARFGCDQGVELVEGFFDETLPGLRDHRWSVVRLDGDTYEATWVGLESLYPGLSAGGYLIVDDYGLIKECQAAVDDYRREHGITEPIEKIDWNEVRWRREDEPEPSAASPAGTSRGVSTPSSARPGGNAARTRIPTERELELERELRELRERLGIVGGQPGEESR